MNNVFEIFPEFYSLLSNYRVAEKLKASVVSESISVRRNPETSSGQAQLNTYSVPWLKKITMSKTLLEPRFTTFTASFSYLFELCYGIDECYIFPFPKILLKNLKMFF